MQRLAFAYVYHFDSFQALEILLSLPGHPFHRTRFGLEICHLGFGFHNFGIE